MEMSYEEKNATVSLMNSGFILGFYLLRLWQMAQSGTMNEIAVYSLWATIIVVAIIASVAANVITQIVTGIIHTVRTDEEESYFTDERDRLIGLIGARNSGVALGIGVFIAMLTLVFNQPVLVMFNLLIFFMIVAEILGSLTRIYLYRRGI